MEATTGIITALLTAAAFVFTIYQFRRNRAERASELAAQERQRRRLVTAWATLPNVDDTGHHPRWTETRIYVRNGTDEQITRVIAAPILYDRYHEPLKVSGVAAQVGS